MTLAVEIDEGPPPTETVLMDWELLERLNGLVGGRGFRAKVSGPPADLAQVEQTINRGMSLVRIRASELGLPFRFPEVEPLAVLWPVAGKEPGPEEEDEDAANDGENGKHSPNV